MNDVDRRLPASGPTIAAGISHIPLRSLGNVPVRAHSGTMLAIKSTPAPSPFKRSTSIWRRLSRKEFTPTRPMGELRDARSTQKLQKRATESKQIHDTVQYIITHMQTVPPPVRRLDTQYHHNRRVVSSDMATSPFPRSPREIRTVVWDVFLTPEQVYNLVMGYAPEQMDDKWFVYSEGPDSSGKLKVHFHRSWTGIKIAELFVLIDLKGEGAGKIVGIKWNGTDQTNHMDEKEAKYMISKTLAWVLDVVVETETS